MQLQNVYEYEGNSSSKRDRYCSNGVHRVGKQSNKIGRYSILSHLEIPEAKLSLTFVSFQDESGYKNPYKDLKSCYGKGETGEKQDENILHLYPEA